MKLKRWSILVQIVFLVIISVACGWGQSGSESTPVPSDASPMPEVTSAVQPIPASATPPEDAVLDPTGECPRPGSDESLYISVENGFCFLVPTGITIEHDSMRPDLAIFLRGPLETRGPKQGEVASVWMNIALNGPADGLDSEGYAQRWINTYAKRETPDMEYQAAPIKLGGQTAIVLSDLPGFIPTRTAFVIANNLRYTLTLAPQPGIVPELDEPASNLWAVVVNSIVFFPTQPERVWVSAEAVCPLEAPETRLYRNDEEGFCFLYPADFEEDPDIPGRVLGGPVVAQEPGFGEVRESLVVGSYGYWQDSTPRQVIEPSLEFIDPASIVDATIGGYPAVVYKTIQPPWPHRIAMILVKGRAYSITANPWDSERFPLGAEPLERMWVSVTGSLAFYDPWR